MSRSAAVRTGVGRAPRRELGCGDQRGVASLARVKSSGEAVVSLACRIFFHGQSGLYASLFQIFGFALFRVLKNVCEPNG